MSNDNLIERVPDAVIPRRRISAFVRVLGSLVIWGMLFALAIGGLLFWAWGVYTTEGPLKVSTVVLLPEGASRSEITRTLEEKGVITDARVMNAASLVASVRGATLKPGEYEFPAGAPMAAVVNTITNGKVLTYKLTIPEGWTSKMALDRVNSNEVLTGDPVALLPEAMLIADTQVFRRGMTRGKLVEDMKSAQTKLVDEIWGRKPADSILKTKEEMVTLASIVEKETGKSEERARVAAVFLNRLKKGMRLQSDPTIIYGIVGGQGRLERAITRADIDTATPYNTYQINGLPPGPIATPGRASLEAVVAPAVTEELFFVADGTGGHAFAVTLDEHNANVKKWREGQKNGIQLPGESEAPATPGEPAAAVEQTPLPAVTNAPAAPVANDEAVAAAVKDAEKAAVVPEPAEGAGSAQPAKAEPKAAEPPPLPVEKKPKPLVAEVPAVTTTPAAPVAAPKPGSVVKVGAKSVPIPRLKRAKP